MTDEAQQSDTPDVVDAPQTLDDVISEFNVQTQAPVQQAAPNTAQEFKPAQTQQHIDPYDETSLNQWASQTANQQTALEQQVQELTSKLTQQEQVRAQAIVDADIKNAVSKITESVEGIDPLMAEIYLEKRAAENEGFKSIWDNRSKNPKALEAALGAITNELEGKFQFKADPQIAENHRAAKQSTQSNNTQKTTEYANSLEKALAEASSEGERRRIWSNAKNLGY